MGQTVIYANPNVLILKFVNSAKITGQPLCSFSTAIYETKWFYLAPPEESDLW